MSMFPYQMRFLVIAIALVALGGVVVWGWTAGWGMAAIVPLLLFVVWLVWRLLKEATLLPNQFNYFLRSLIGHDYMIKFPTTRDKTLGNIYENMNRIVASFKDNLLDIEYKKLYYDRVLRIMTHELRNTLTPVISLSSDMTKNPAKYAGKRMEESAEIIYDQCCTMKNFLDSYRMLSHLPTPDRAEVSVEELFRKVQRLMGDIPSVTFSWGKDMTICADAEQLIQVLTNLIKNAHEATEGMDDATIQVVATEADGTSCIRVTDNGRGVPEEMKEQIFLPFYTTKSGGMGVGLCLSRQIMRLHGGDLRLSSHHGRGASFLLTFG